MKTQIKLPETTVKLIKKIVNQRVEDIQLGNLRRNHHQNNSQ